MCATAARAWMLAVVLCCGLAHAANTYYVSPAGSDTANDGSQASPFREIRQALTKVVAGDTVLVADGQYLGFNVDTLTGTAASPITIQAQGTGAIINITTDRSDNRDTIFVTFSSYIVIDGLHSTGANRAAMRVDQSPHVTVRNCVFGNNTTWGLFTDFSDDLLIENNECYGSVQQHGVYVSNTCTRPTVRGNRLHDNASCGLHMNGDVSQGGAGVITNALVENNIIYNNGSLGGSGINCDGVQNSVFRNNLIYSALAAGISLYQQDASAPSINAVVINNTIDVAATGKWAIQIHNGSSGAVVFNNILLNHNAARGSIHLTVPGDQQGLVSDYNILTTNAHVVTPDDDSTDLTLAQWQALGFDKHSTANSEANLFVNSTGGDFHLKTGSPAIDAGTAVLGGKNAPPGDLDKNSRPQGATFDIGSYEFVTAVTNQPPVLTSPASAAPSAAVTGQSVTFSVGASDPENDTLTYSWAVSDGTSGSASSLTESFAAAGTYQATVTISDGHNTPITSTVSVVVSAASGGSGGGTGGTSGTGGNGGTGGSGAGGGTGTGVGGGGSAPIPITVSKLLGRVNFTRGGHDGALVWGVIPALPALFDPTGKTVVLNVAGASVTFTLDKNGHAKAANGTFMILLKPSKRNKTTHKIEFQGGDVVFKAALKNGTYAQTWQTSSTAQNVNAMKTSDSVSVQIQFNGNTYAATVAALYTAKVGKTGMFKK